MMYENLIETLRFCAKNGDCHDCPYEKPCAGTMGDGLYCEAADALEEVTAIAESYKRSMEAWADEAARAQPRWIPVTERLPEEDEEVLVVAVNDFDKYDRWAAVDWLYRGEWQQHSIVTHWMPLPELPKEEAQ